MERNKADVWAVGVMTFRMLTGEFPWSSTEINRKTRRPVKEVVSGFNNKTLFTEDPKDRPNAKSALQNEWFHMSD